MTALLRTVSVEKGKIASVFSSLLTAKAAVAQTPTAEEKITEAVELNSQGESIVYKELVGPDELQAGLKLFQQALAIFKQYGAKAGEAKSLLVISTSSELSLSSRIFNFYK